MMAIVIIILAALIGVGGGYGVFKYAKPLQGAPIASSEQEVAEKGRTEVQEQFQQTASLQDEYISELSIKHLYENDELTKEGALIFLKLRANMYGLSPDKTSKMIEDLNKMSRKIPVIDAFKVVAMQYKIMDFVEFKEPKIQGL